MNSLGRRTGSITTRNRALTILVIGYRIFQMSLYSIIPQRWKIRCVTIFCLVDHLGEQRFQYIKLWPPPVDGYLRTIQG